MVRPPVPAGQKMEAEMDRDRNRPIDGFLQRARDE